MTGRWRAMTVSLLLLAACSTGPQGASPAQPPGPSGTAPSGSPPEIAAAGCPPGALPDQPGDAAQARPALRDWFQLLAVDPTAARILAGATGFNPEGSGQPTVDVLWAFDTCTNTWAQVRTQSLPRAGPGLPLAQLVADPAHRQVLGLPVGLSPVWVYDPLLAQWSEVSTSEGGSDEAWPAAVADPASGEVLAFDPNVMRADPAASGVLRYDPSRGTWTSLSPADPLGDSPRVRMDSYDVAYDAAAGLLVLVITPQGSDPAPAQTWTFDGSSRTWDRGADVPRSLPGGYPAQGWAASFDPATGRTWWFADSAMLGYDARADAWSVAPRGTGWPGPQVIGGVEVDPVARLVGAMVHDPVNERLVVVGGWVRPAGQQPGGFVAEGGLVATDDVWAYVPATNSWSMLLAASDAPASYGPG